MPGLMRRLVVPDYCQIRIDGSALVLQLPEGSLDNTKSLHMREITKRFVICAIVTTIWNKLACHSLRLISACARMLIRAFLPTTARAISPIALAVSLPPCRKQTATEKNCDTCQDEWSDAAAGSVARR